MREREKREVAREGARGGGGVQHSDRETKPGGQRPEIQTKPNLH